MDSLFFLIPIAILFIAVATRLLFWAIGNGQYDDLETEGRRILFDEDPPVETSDEATENEATENKERE